MKQCDCLHITYKHVIIKRTGQCTVAETQPKRSFVRIGNVLVILVSVGKRACFL